MYANGERNEDKLICIYRMINEFIICTNGKHSDDWWSLKGLMFHDWIIYSSADRGIYVYSTHINDTHYASRYNHMQSHITAVIVGQAHSHFFK